MAESKAALIDSTLVISLPEVADPSETDDQGALSLDHFVPPAKEKALY